MTDLPPEVAEARRILQRVKPRPFSRARVYQRLLNQRAQRPRIPARAVIVLFCLAASSSAMAFGYRWVTLRQVPAAHPSARTVPSVLAVPVPRKQHGSRSASADRVAEENELKTAPAAASAIAPPGPGAQERPRQPAAFTATPAQGRSPAVQESLQPADASQDSELSQQVREYQAAVAPMRNNPQLVLERLRAYRQKWRHSVIGEEVDLREIEALLALGRRVEAMGAARRFVQHHPASARAADMQRMADEVPRGRGRFD